jgi:hypothetical protein
MRDDAHGVAAHGSFTAASASMRRGRRLRRAAQACAACVALMQAAAHAGERAGPIARPIPSSAVALPLASAPATNSVTNSVTTPAPVFAPTPASAPALSGAAYRVASQAYSDYDRRDYKHAEALAREAIRQRPDVLELRLLLANALAAQRRYGAASRALGEAIGAFGRQRALLKRRAQLDSLSAAADKLARAPHTPASAGEALTGEAFDAAQLAYRAYADKRYAQAAQQAQRAVALAPGVLRLRLLLIDAASGAGNDVLAWQSDVDAVQRFGDSDELRLRRTFIGNGLGPKASRRAFAARAAGDSQGTIAAEREAVAYAPDNIDYRVQLFDSLVELGDWPALEAAASEAIAYDDTEVMPFVFRAYARAEQQRTAQADADLATALRGQDVTRSTQNSARAIAADIWMAQGRAQYAIDRLSALAPTGDDSDALTAERLGRAHRLIAASKRSPSSLGQARPMVDCEDDPDFGASCDVWPADPAFAAQRALERASEQGDKQAALRYAREAVAAAPDSARHRTALIDALEDAGQAREAAHEARALIDDGLLDSLPALDAAYVARQAGDEARASALFRQADAQRKLAGSSLGDAGYAAAAAHRDADSARYFERAIDSLSAERRPTVPATARGEAAQEIETLRAAHAEATRKWGFDVSLDYRGAGLQRGYAATPNASTSNGWQTGAEIYWRPLGSLGDRMLELYARGYESFGVAGGGASGASSLEAAFGVRGKPFASIDAIAAFERIVPIGSQTQGDWLARLAYSGGIGTERRVDVPSWWTASLYAEGGHYVSRGSNYATALMEAGRTYRLDRISPRLTVFPYAVAGADYDSTINQTVPIGAGVGMSTRYAFRDGKYDASRSSIELSIQYRWKLTGDDRARGVFCSALFAY